MNIDQWVDERIQSWGDYSSIEKTVTFGVAKADQEDAAKVFPDSTDKVVSSLFFKCCKRVLDEKYVLVDYNTGEELRQATGVEVLRSLASAGKHGGAGAITVDGQSVFVMVK